MRHRHHRPRDAGPTPSSTEALREYERDGRRFRRPRIRRAKSYARPSRKAGTRREEFPYTSRGALLSRGEAAFFRPLRRAVGRDFLIMCKVRLADVVTCPVRRDRRGPFAAISQKHLDFVLCELKTTRIILAVELDDRSHEAEHRKRRDRFLNETLQAAGIRLLRIKARAQYSSDIIRRLVFARLRRTTSAISAPGAASHTPALAP